jgi:hypothetical protein
MSEPGFVRRKPDPEAVKKRVRLTHAQVHLLEELDDKGGLYISRHMRYGRTAAILVEKGLAFIYEHDHSRLRQDHYVVTEAGRAWLDA